MSGCINLQSVWCVQHSWYLSSRKFVADVVLVFYESSLTYEEGGISPIERSVMYVKRNGKCTPSHGTIATV